MADTTTLTTSWSFPNMFDVTKNSVSVMEGNRSIVNRTRLLILTDPTEVYNEPTFGVGLKKYLWQYNTKNTKAIIQDKIKDQLREYEPCVDADKTSFADGLLFTGNGNADATAQEYNQLKMTVGLSTIYEDKLNVVVNLEEEQAKMFGTETQEG